MACVALAGENGASDDFTEVPLEESNCALIGSDEDKAVRHAAALEEPAWRGAGESPGLLAWRIEDFKVVPWDQSKYCPGSISLHTGDSYIVLETVLGGPRKDKLENHIFFWLGAESSLDEEGTAAYKTVELDEYFHGMATQSRETEGHESVAFRHIFPRITYLAGGVASGFRRVVSGLNWAHQLLQVRKTKDGVVCKEVRLARESLNSGDCFVLDAGIDIYIWHGEEAHPLERYESNIVGERLENKRTGHAKATHECDDRFWDLLGGRGPVKTSAEGTDRIPEVEIGEGILFKIGNGPAGTLHMEEVAREDLRSHMLDGASVMMVDTLKELMLWTGKLAPAGDKKGAYSSAMSYLKANDKSKNTPIHMFKDGVEIRNAQWNKIFED